MRKKADQSELKAIESLSAHIMNKFIREPLMSQSIDTKRVDDGLMMKSIINRNSKCLAHESTR